MTFYDDWMYIDNIGEEETNKLLKYLNDLKKITSHLNNADRSVNYDKKEVNVFEKLNSEYSNVNKDDELAEIKEKESQFVHRGGKFVTHVPVVRIV